ncbi:MAG: thermonuclease family protein [Alphaproteobacteria bacterium]|nr:thermonuclease family protein [Alphaproteobacteria bacterium]
MKKTALALTLLCFALPASAQEAPAPRKMPRTPVQRESLPGSKPAAPSSRQIQGTAAITDGDRLRVNGFDLRLFGIVPPQLSASFGPQARAAVDTLTAGQTVTCSIRDRDRDGRFLATCRNASNADLALELLRRGLAVAARGSLGTTEYATPYLAAEQSAQIQKIGIWSMAMTAATPARDTAKISVPVAAAPPPAGAPKEDKEAAPAVEIAEKPPVKIAEPASAISIPAVIAHDMAVAEQASMPGLSEPGFVERYQLLVTALVMLVTALSIMAVISVQRRLDRLAEARAIAAALRGELMAARAVCQARIRALANESSDKIAWPRIRTTLYQAYVGRLGWLGAELARQVASIYGQSSDYAAYYEGGDEARAQAMPKKRALQILVQHIDEVLPRLALIEQTGQASSIKKMPPLRPHAAAPKAAPVKIETPAPQPQGEIALGELAPEAPVAVAPRAPSPWQLWEAVQKLARGNRVERKKAETKTPEELVADYTAMIEEEMKRFSFGLGDDEVEPPPANITRFRGTNG